VEAMTMADKIVVVNAGRIEQVGSPLELYRSPANRFVAGFIGSPKMNIIEGTHSQRYGAYAIGVRPEHIGLSKAKGDWEGTVGVAEHLGSDTFLHVNVEGIGVVTARADGDVDVAHGERVFLTPNVARIHRFDELGNSER
jgi:multiple sugar transport system ATP-binding protein